MEQSHFNTVKLYLFMNIKRFFYKTATDIPPVLRDS